MKKITTLLNHFNTNKNKKTKFLCLLILIICQTLSKAQTWTQLGQGAGGQTMALYSEIILNSNPPKYDFYIGSDVAGVWKASNIPYTGITDVNNYQYSYISNHEIMRYAQKFYRPLAINGSYDSQYIFVGSSSGIHRIDNSTATPQMTQIWNLKDSWVSDMFFTSNYVTPTSGPKIAYYVTGNTKIGSNDDIDGKDADLFDFYLGTINSTETGFTNVKKTNLTGHPAKPKTLNVYCLLVNDNGSSIITDDDFYVGAENGLHHFTYTEANSANNSTLSSSLITAPQNIPTTYGVSSITRFDATRLLVTFYLTASCSTSACLTNAAVYIYDMSGVSYPWTPLMNNLIGTAPNSSPTTHDFITDNNKDGLFHFTKLIPLLDNAITPNITGYLLFSEDNDHKANNSGINYFNGVYYCGINGTAGSNFYLPNGNWQAMQADDVTGSTNDWGWNKAGRPCANPNSAIVIKDGNGDNNLIVGKTGNFFASKIPANPVSGNIWKQLFTKKTSKAAPCTGITNDVYENIGYVNTAAQSILPLPTGEVWYSERDRQITYSDDNGLTGTQVTQFTNCPQIALGTTLDCLPYSGGYKLSDCFFITKNTANKTDDKLYAGIAEGFGGAFGRGMVMQYDKATGVWGLLNGNSNSAIFCGDPLKMLFTGTSYFAIIRDDSKHEKLYKFDAAGTWNMISLTVNTDILDAVFSPDGTKLIVLNEGATANDPNTLNVYNYSIGTFSSACSTNFNANLVGKQLAVYPYNNNTAYKVLCAFRDRTGFQSSSTNKLLEVYDSGNTSPCTTTVVSNNCTASGTLPSIFQTLIDYDDADGGVTAIEVNSDISTIYVATVNYVAPIMQSRLYRANYNPVTGIIDNCWYDISGHPPVDKFPNKSIQFMNSIGSTYNNEQIYTCVRGMGEWKNKIITPTQCGNYPNDFTATTASVPDNNFNVNANVNISGSKSFTGCSFAVAQGVAINVPSGASLTLTNCYLKACGNMWQGIVVKSGGTLTINNTNIMDAQYAVEVKSGGNFDCNGATFDRNYVGVYTNNTPATISIKGSTFKCTGCLTGNPLKTGYTGQPTTGSNTFAGILAANATFNIGVSGAASNVFDGLYRGVSLKNCYTTVLNSTFKNMPLQSEYFELPTDMGGGIGIVADVTSAGNLTQYGFGDYTGATASFDNCYYAIMARKSGLSARDNKMTIMVNGINCSSALTGQTLLINTNNIAASKVALALLNNESAASIGVTYNTLTVNGSSARGITVSEFNATAAGRDFGMSCNNITVTKGLDGIYLNSTSRINLQQNFVALPLTTAANGIRLNGTSYCNLTENSVNGNLSLSTTTCFLGSLSENNSFINNHANNSTYGFNFADACPYTTYKGNTLNNHQVGLAIGSSGVIGIQTQAGNKWSGTFYSGDGAINSNLTSAGVAASQFLVHVTTPGLYRPVYSAPNEDPFNPWFKSLPGTPFSATFANICDAYRTISDENNALRLDTMIASNSITSIDYEQELKYKVARSLQSKLSDNDALKNDNGLFENYFDSVQNTSAGAFSAIQFEIENNAIDLVTLNVDSLIRLKMDSLVVIDSLIFSNPNNNFSIEKSNLIAEFQLLIAQVSANQQLAKTQKDSLFQVLQIQNQTISYTNNIEEIEKEINDFHFLYSDSLLGAINSNRINTVIYIASLCPYAYGKGVYQARSELTRLGIDTLEYDDQANCAQLGYFRKANVGFEKNIETPMFYVTPNPTKDNAAFYFDKGAIGGTLIIKDAYGKTLFSTKVNSQQNNFNCPLQGFAPGIYFVNLVINNNVANTIKLVVIK